MPRSAWRRSGVGTLALTTLLTTALAGTLWAEGPVMVRAMGYHRTRDSRIWIWQGNKKKMRTAVHELLHRATREVPREANKELVRITDDPKINEGLTSYFTNRALQATGRDATYPDPAPGATFGELRAWSRGLRTEARGAIQETFGIAVDTGHIMVLSDKCFGRCYQRDAGRPWEQHPGQPGVYGNSRERVETLVRLVGEPLVRSAYFQGQVDPLRTALQQVQRRNPRDLPDWIKL